MVKQKVRPSFKSVKIPTGGITGKGFTPGRPKTGGRVKGTPNKFTTLKNAFLEAFQGLGGVQGLMEWAQRCDDNRKDFYRMTARMLPREVLVAGTEPISPNNLEALTDDELKTMLSGLDNADDS